MDLTNGGWRHSKLPGHGEIDLGAFIKALHDGGYDGPLSIELEDREWIENLQKVQEGFILSQSYLKPLIDAYC